MDKIIYIANIRLPTEKAHGIQIMEMCHAFALNGVEVDLVVADRKTKINGVVQEIDPFVFFNIKSNFKIKKLWCLDLVSWGKVGFRIQTLTFLISIFFYSFFKKNLFYTREESVAFLLTHLGKKVVWETHMGQINFFVKSLLKKKVPIVAITRGLSDFYAQIGFPRERIHISPDGVDLDKFKIGLSKQEARKNLGFSEDKKAVLYTGHLYSWKGADVLAEAAGNLSQEAEVLFVGGTDKHIEDFKSRFGHKQNIKILGRRPHIEIPIYLRAADLLVLPNSAKEDISKFFTSPMKLFEYMASGVPIVASDLPSVREILTEKSSYFFSPNKPDDLARVISYALKNEDESKDRASAGLDLVKKYSWQNRARNIIGFINENTP